MILCILLFGGGGGLKKKNNFYDLFRRVESRFPDTVQELSLSLKVNDVYVLWIVLTFEY